MTTKLERIALASVVSLLMALASVPPVRGHDLHAPTDTTDTAVPLKTARAIRLGTAVPVIDGRHDDEIWRRAPVQGGFTQRDPDQGETPTERTTFQVAYDDEAIYVAVMCHDSDPSQIRARLTRRDDYASRDVVTIHIDPHHDHRTGFFFDLGVSGAIADGVIYNDDWFDDTWDGVWEGRSAIVEDGWSAEYRIPYHVLRFSEQESYTWGIDVFRRIPRKEEWDHWRLIPRGTNGWLSRLGHLEGISGITPPRHLEVFPFGLSRLTLSPGEDGADDEIDLFATTGLDLRYGVTSNISVNATVNPDFGQVEADPAVLNLSVFETFYRERRPFFLEGRSIFDSPGPDIVGIQSPTRLFHSRRIGRRPSRFGLPDDADEIDRPDNTTIWGAVKVSGKTSRRTSFGILNAVTGSRDARIEQTFTDSIEDVETVERSDFRVEPVTNYFVGRAQQDVLTNSTLGATLTTVHGEGFDAAYVGGIDGQLKWGEDNDYNVFARLTGSRAGQDDDRGSGYEAVAYFFKFSGSFGGQAYVDARSPGFEANDLGFMNRSDRIQSGIHLYGSMLDPWVLARRSSLNFNVWSNRNYDGDNLGRGLNLNTWHQLHNYWNGNVGVSRSFAARDDLATRGGPVMDAPANTRWWGGLGTDDRKAVSLWVGGNGDYGEGGDNVRYQIWVEPEWRPASNIEIEVEPGYSWEKRHAQWVKNIDVDDDGEDDRFIFGELESRVLDVSIRANAAFTPTLSVQFFMQPFVTVGDYRHIKELLPPYGYHFDDYKGLDENPDFSRRALRSNLVLRWEYRPGSTLFLVWQMNRDRDLELEDPAFEPWRGVRRSFTDDGDNILLVKVNYWLGV